MARQSASGRRPSRRRKATPTAARPPAASPPAASPPAEGSSVVWRLPVVLAAWWAWTPLIYALGWCLRFATPGHRFAQLADQWFYANFLTFGTMLWIWCTIGFAGSAFIAGYAARRAWSGKIAIRVVGVVAAVLAAATFVQAWRVAWDDDKDYARYYAASTVFYAPSLLATAAPPSLDRLLRGAHGSDGGCALVGASDVPSCLRVGTLPATGWDARVSSYNGAIYALSRSSGDMQNVSLNSATVHYLNAWRGLPARWSGIMDGTGISQGMGGVAEWDGAHVTTCDFSGRYAIDRSFDGTNMADMADFLAQSYPGLRWTIGDVWGYCSGTEPVVVIPVTMMIRSLNRSVSTAAGVIEVRGSSGKTALTYLPTVAAGTLPGPVYPESLVSTQLAQAAWAAGRGSMNNGGFGYEPTDSAAQAGNAANYLLRSSSSGRLEWVTPLTLRNSTSQLFVAYAVSAADSVASGKLNPLSIYVLSPSDPRQINVDNVEAEARNWLAQQEPGFISSGGKLLEFTPVGGNMWRAYGELNGRVVYLLDMDATGSVAPTLTSVSPLSSGVGGSGGAGGSAGSTAECGKPLASLTASQLAFCLRSFADELAGRAGQQSGAAAGTGTGG